MAKSDSPALQVFTAALLPMHWIMAFDGGLWIVPATLHGWRRRSRWAAGPAGLEPVGPPHARIACMTTGAPLAGAAPAGGAS